jgi:uncharacterized protein
MFEFIMADRKMKLSSLFYDHRTSTLKNSDGTDVIPVVPEKFTPFIAISPDNPGIKTKKVSTLKIQMGLSCNYSCSYCSQSSQIEKTFQTKLTETDDFIEAIVQWIEGAPKRIEFWGGEPFVYWSRLKVLIPALKEKYPNAAMSIVTNGSMFDAEKIEMIDKYDVFIAISHDGPAQSHRGPDPFKDPEKFGYIKKLVDLRPTKVAFNSVIHSKNFDFEAIKKYFDETIGPKAVLNLEGVIAVYDNYTMGNLGKFTKAQYDQLADNVFMELISPNPRFWMLASKANEFMASIKQARPLTSVGQKCGMDKQGNIAVDLLGNVMTCQNTGAKGEHHIGHINDPENIKLNTATHFSFREECSGCPVVQLCKGSCMFLQQDFFAQSCWNEYYFNIGILKAALFRMTNKVLINIQGNIMRPEFSEQHLKKYPDLRSLYETQPI